MSENEEPGQEPEQDESFVGRLSGKTTTHTVDVLITNTKVGRNNYFVIYGDLKEDGTAPERPPGIFAGERKGDRKSDR